MKRIHIGFSGTRHGMTDAQQTLLRTYLERGKRFIEGFHHGDCVGADAQAHAIAADVLGVDRIWIHPPSDPKYRAYCVSPNILPTEDYLKRDRNIVDATAGLVAAPKTPHEERRSGTWYTIRYACKMQKPHKKLLP